jgi:hypothetical protein
MDKLSTYDGLFGWLVSLAWLCISIVCVASSILHPLLSAQTDLSTFLFCARRFSPENLLTGWR